MLNIILQLILSYKLPSKRLIVWTSLINLNCCFFTTYTLFFV